MFSFFSRFYFLFVERVDVGESVESPQQCHFGPSHFCSNLPSFVWSDGARCLAGDGAPSQMVGYRSSAGLTHLRRVGPKLAAIQQTFIPSRTKSVRSKVGGRPQQFRASAPPEVVVEAAKNSVDGIEAALGALAAMGTIDGPEVQVLKDCLSRVKRSAQERLLAIQNSQTESHLERARKRLTAHDAARQTLVTDTEQSEGRLERLRAAAATADAILRPRPPAEVETQVQGLQQMVNQLQEERDVLVRELHGAPMERPRVRQRLSRAHRSGVIPPMPILIPGDVDAGTPWRSAGRHERREQWEDPRVDINVVECCREDGKDDRRSDNDTLTKERSRSRYGLRGVRIGEASHQGPRLLRRYPGVQRVHDISSDEKPLIPSGRNVVPRLSGVDSTIPATPRALVEAGRELSPAVTEKEIVPVPPTPKVSRAVLVSGVQGDVFQTGVTVVDTSSNDTDQEEVGGRMRGNRFALREAGDDGQHFGDRGRPPAKRRWVLVSGQPTQPTTSGMQTRRASRECQMWNFTMLWNPQLSLNPLTWIEHQEELSRVWTK